MRILQGAEVVAATFPWRSCCHHRAKHVWLAHASHRSFCSSTKTLIEVTVGAYTNRSHPWTVIPLGVPGATNLLFDLDQVCLLYFFPYFFPQFNSFSPSLRFLLLLFGMGSSDFCWMFLSWRRWWTIREEEEERKRWRKKIKLTFTALNLH